MTTNALQVPLMRPLLPTAERLLPYLRQIDEARWYSNFGPMVNAFETRLAAQLALTQEELVCVVSGTIGLTLSLRAFDPEPGAYCLMPSWTFAASANAVRWAGMQPWFLDVDEANWMITPDIVRRILADFRGTVGAVMPVSAFGAPVDIAAWDEFRQETGVPVVIDAAAAFDGARFGAAPVVVSLHATKILGIGEGAFIASRDLDISARIRALSNFGFAGARESVFDGTNGKISEYAAAAGMAALDMWPETRVAFASATQRYRAAFKDVAGASLAPGLSQSHLRSTFNIRLSEPDADRLMANLGDAGIGTRQWWGKGCHAMPAFAKAPRAALPVTEALADTVVGLPFSQDITAGEIRRVRDAVDKAFNR